MSASRAGKAALKKAKVPVSTPRTKGKKNPIDNVSSNPVGAPLPKRPNPRLDTTTPRKVAQPKRPNPHLDTTPPKKVAHGVSPRIMTAFGVSTLAIGTYCGYLVASYKREVARSQSLDVPKDVSDRYNHTARTFDAEVDMSETLMRMGSKRRDLVQMARGNALEVSCGTGRNLDYYELGERRGVNRKGKPDILGCRSITFVDLSPEMVAITREKFEKMYPDFKKVAFRVQSAGEVAPPPGMYYDTIIQTMGLCSMPDPVGTLRHLGSITEPNKGQILLLEHGRSHYDWLNSILDNLAPAHADRHGCWWNRDIGEIVKESGLEVVEEKRWHFGTTWRYVLRPKGSPQE